MKLRRYFSITSFLVMVIVSALLAMGYRWIALRDLTELAESRNIALTRAFSNSLWPRLAPLVAAKKRFRADELRARPEVPKLQQAVLSQVKGLDIVKVNVYNLEGLTVFSTEAKQIGEDKSAHAGFLAARSGKVASELTHRDAFSALERTLENLDVFSSYIPIRRNPTAPIEGVFELDSNVTLLVQKVMQTQITVFAAVILVLALLYLCLFLIVSHADSVMKRQEIKLEEYLGRIKSTNERLEEHVRQRREELSSINEQLQTEMAERHRTEERLRVLQEIDEAITSTLDLRNVLNVLLDKIALSLPYPTATVRLFNRESGLLEAIVCRNLDDKEWEAEQSKTGHGLANVVIKAKGPVMISNAQTDPRVRDRDFYRKHSLVSYLGVPLIVKDEILGVLGFYTKEEHRFAGEEITFLSTLAGRAAIAIHNAQLYEEARLKQTQLQETSRMLSALHSVVASVSRSLDLDRVLRATTDKITAIFRFDAARIHIYDERTDALLLRASFDGDLDRATSARSFERGQGIVGKVAESGKPLIFEDVETDPLYHQLSGTKVSTQFGYRFLAVFPIKGRLKNLGTLACVGAAPRKLNSGEIQRLEAVADQMAVAIENSELYEQLTQKVEELQQKTDELERANKVKDEFLSVMSHELRTPLNVVMGYSGMIKDGMLGDTNPEQKKALEKIMSRTNDLLSMITSILYATSIEANEVRVENNQFAVVDSLDELRRAHEIPLGKPVTLIWDYPSDLPAVTSDREKLKRVLQNLINNAIKFTKTGQVTVSARKKAGGGQRVVDGDRQSAISREPSGNSAQVEFVEFKVADTGIGISAEKVPIIFEKFRQADSSETRLYGGVGLGLFIAKNFTELLGGEIEVETEPGKGSTFTVTIPCTVCPAAREDRRGHGHGAARRDVTDLSPSSSSLRSEGVGEPTRESDGLMVDE